MSAHSRLKHDSYFPLVSARQAKLHLEQGNFQATYLAWLAARDAHVARRNTGNLPSPAARQATMRILHEVAQKLGLEGGVRNHACFSATLA